MQTVDVPMRTVDAPMRTVAIMNQKGGCGKTTTAVNLAACLAKLGHRTLLVDMDPQGHCAVGLAIPEEQIERGMYDLLVPPEAPSAGPGVGEVVWQIATDFDLAPSDLRLAAFEQVYAGVDGRERRLADVLATVADTYEWCVIDNPPGVGLLTFNSLYAADEVIVPVETGFFSLHGLAKMMETLEEMKERCDSRVQVRVLPTLYDTRTKLAREVLSELRNKFRDHLMQSTVNFNTKLKEAASFGQPITEYDPGSRGYKDFLNLAREIMGTPAETRVEASAEKLTRPQELVQRAKQLAQMTNLKFNRPRPLPSDEAQIPEHIDVPTTASSTTEPVLRGRLADPGPDTDAERAARATERKLERFYGVRQTEQGVEFAARFDNARHVQIAGDFNGWSPVGTPMERRQDTQAWVTRLPLSPGRYRYKFVVDGLWLNDPHNRTAEPNEYGEMNNVVDVH